MSRLDAFDAELSEAAEKAALLALGEAVPVRGPLPLCLDSTPRRGFVCAGLIDVGGVPTRDSPRRSGSGWSEAIGSARPPDMEDRTS